MPARTRRLVRAGIRAVGPLAACGLEVVFLSSREDDLLDGRRPAARRAAGGNGMTRRTVAAARALTGKEWTDHEPRSGSRDAGAGGSADEQGHRFLRGGALRSRLAWSAAAVVETLEQQVRAGTRPTRSSPPTSPGSSTCARCKTPTRCCSTGWCPATSRRCCRSSTPRLSGWPASASARSTAVRAAFSSPIPTATASGRSCEPAPAEGRRYRRHRRATGSWAG